MAGTTSHPHDHQGGHRACGYFDHLFRGVGGAFRTSVSDLFHLRPRNDRRSGYRLWLHLASDYASTNWETPALLNPLWPRLKATAELAIWLFLSGTLTQVADWSGGSFLPERTSHDHSGTTACSAAPKPDFG